MALRRFYIDDFELNAALGEIPIQGELFHHISDVVRFAQGDRFELLPGDGRAVLVEVTAVEKRAMRVRAVHERILPELPRPWITLCVSVPKLPKMDWIIEKSVELGVFEIRPFISDFSFLRKAAELSENRLARWEKLIKAATQQTGRGQRMGIHPAVSLEKLLAEFSRGEKRGGLFPYEGEAALGFRRAMEILKAKELRELWLFIGSEGGFSAREVEIFKAHGLDPVTLGEQILRVETACLAVTSVIKYEYEQFEYGSIR